MEDFANPYINLKFGNMNNVQLIKCCLFKKNSKNS